MYRIDLISKLVKEFRAAGITTGDDAALAYIGYAMNAHNSQRLNRTEIAHLLNRWTKSTPDSLAILNQYPELS